MGDVLFFFHRNIIDTCYKKVVATTLFSFPIVPKTSLVFQVIFVMALVGERLLFATRFINKGSGSRLILSEVIILLFCQSIPLETLGINLLDAKRWLQQNSCFYNNTFLNYFVPGVSFLASDIQLDPDEGFQVFSKVLDQDLLIENCNKVEIPWDCWQVLQICASVMSFFQLVFEIFLNLLSVAIHKDLGLFQAFVQKYLKLVLCDQNRAIFVLFLFILL